MVLHYCRYVSRVYCVYLSCICYEHGLHVDMHTHTHTHTHTHIFLKIVTFVSYLGHTLFFWVFKLLWWCGQALSSCWDVAPCHWVIVAQCFWDTWWSQLQGANVQFSSKDIWPLKMGPPCWPKISGINHPVMQTNIPEDSRAQTSFRIRAKVCCILDV
jgi:hypothetical protein